MHAFIAALLMFRPLAHAQECTSYGVSVTRFHTENSDAHLAMIARRCAFDVASDWAQSFPFSASCLNTQPHPVCQNN